MTPRIERIARRMEQRERRGQLPCDRCDGVGTREYAGNGWRGGMSVSGMRVDVCDACWGSGDSTRPGANIAELEAARETWKEEQVLHHFAHAAGASLPSHREYMLAIAGILDREEQRKKTPFPASDLFWRAALRSVSNALRRCAASDVKR